MAKAQKETTFLVSSEKTGYFYTNRKNKKKNKGEKKLSLRKYDPVARKHVEFAEKKLSKLKVKYERKEAGAEKSEPKQGKKAA